MYNKIQLIGRLGKDPVKHGEDKSDLCNFSVATTSREKDKEGNWVDHTEWFNVVLFGKTAENAANYLRKGKLVFVEGRLKTEKYKDKEGMEKQITKLYGSEVRFLSPKDEVSGNNSGHETQTFDSSFGADDDIPF